MEEGRKKGEDGETKQREEMVDGFEERKAMRQEEGRQRLCESGGEMRWGVQTGCMW